MSREFPCVHYDDGFCKKFSVGGCTSYCARVSSCEYRVKSNGDSIRDMTDEELAQFLEGDYGNMATGAALNWLRQPAKEG